MNITFIGSGNVATALAEHFYTNGHNIKNVYSRTFENAEILSKRVNAIPLQNVKQITKTPSDVIIISVSDDSIENTVTQLETERLVLHTAGSVSMNVLKKFKNHGVLYPMQTFSKNKKVDAQSIPFFIEANTRENVEKIKGLAKSISPSVTELDSNSRLLLHITAVFSCNFTNHLFALSEDILKKLNLDFSILSPLVKETMQKAMFQSPSISQTGPAARNDKKIIEKHVKNLDLFPKHQEIYKILSDSIIQRGKWQILKKS